MSTVKKTRLGTNDYFNIQLADNGVQVNWPDVDIQEVFMYSEDQRVYSGRCLFATDSEHPETLHVTYPAEKQAYLGPHRLTVRISLDGAVNTYDALAIDKVATLEECGDADESPEVINIAISEVNTTIMHEILAACQAATQEALRAAASVDVEALEALAETVAEQKAETVAASVAAQHLPQVRGGYWYVWDSVQQDYVNTGTKAEGTDGARGADGTLYLPKFRITAAMELQVSKPTADDMDRFKLEDGVLKYRIN